MGPTGCGKTSFSIELTKYLPIEVISVDSGSIYKYLNIGTAKPNSQQLSMVSCNLINIREPHESYSVAEFFFDSVKLVKDIHNRGKIPVFVGGTMLYYKVLLNGLKKSPKKSQNLRKKILHIFKAKGTQFLYNFLKKKFWFFKEHTS